MAATWFCSSPLFSSWPSTPWRPGFSSTTGVKKATPSSWLLTLGPSAFWVLKLAPLPLMFAYFAAKRFFAWTQVLALTLFSVYTVLAGFHLYWIYRINLIPIP